MTILGKSIYQEIAEKLETAPKDILENVLGYVDGILDNKNFPDFELSKAQENSLLKIKKHPCSEHTDMDMFLDEMNENMASKILVSDFRRPHPFFFYLCRH